MLYKFMNRLVIMFAVGLCFQLFQNIGLSAQQLHYDSSFVKIGGNHLMVYNAGRGKDVIVFESGLGMDGKTWFNHGIIEVFAKNHQIITYNRAGYAPSSVGTEIRNVQQLANDLAELIQLRSPDRRVTIVGHSLGGAIARTYAIQHPEKVRTLLLIDPNHEKYTPYANIQQEVIDTLVWQLNEYGLAGAALEAKELISNLSFLKSLPNLPDIPVVVLTSTQKNDEMNEKNIEDWTLAHESLGLGVKKFTHIKTDKSGHFIYAEEPGLVIKYLKHLLK